MPELPVAQGEFRVYVYLGDEKALHVHDVRILKPGFSVVSPEYVVGLVAPRHRLDACPRRPAADGGAAPADGVAASS